MIEKIKTYQDYLLRYVRELQDVRTVGLVMFLVVTLLISWSGIKVIETNYDLQKDITRLKQQNEVNKLENQNLQLENEYYNTEEYLELEARKNFGLAAPGETVVVVPKSVALSHTVDQPQLITTAIEQEKDTGTDKPKYRQNFEAWMDFLFHRQSKN